MDQFGHKVISCMLKAEHDEWRGKNYINWWRPEDQLDGQGESELEMNMDWNGFTIVELSPLGDETVEPEAIDCAAKTARPFLVPTEPTPTQRSFHELTHLPNESWPPICVTSKGKETHPKKSTGRQRVIQVEYRFVKTSEHEDTTTIITAVDMQTGLGMSVVTPSKGKGKRCIAELKRFIFEIGRTYGIIQYDFEPSLKALITELLKERGGMSMRATPKDWKQAHGSVGRWQQNFYGQVRALRLQLHERCNVNVTSDGCVLPMDCETCSVHFEPFHDSR